MARRLLATGAEFDYSESFATTDGTKRVETVTLAGLTELTRSDGQASRRLLGRG